MNLQFNFSFGIVNQTENFTNFCFRVYFQDRRGYAEIIKENKTFENYYKVSYFEIYVLYGRYRVCPILCEELGQHCFVKDMKYLGFKAVK